MCNQLARKQGYRASRLYDTTGAGDEFQRWERAHDVRKQVLDSIPGSLPIIHAQQARKTISPVNCQVLQRGGIVRANIERRSIIKAHHQAFEEVMWGKL